MSRNLLIVLHGVGSNGADLAPFGELWSRGLPDTDFAAPDAPFAFPYGGGRQWFSLDGVTPQNRPGRVAAARESFDRLIGAIVSAHGLENHLDRVALVGFSQGAIMALDALASGRWPVAAVVAFSGRLASPPPLTPSIGTRVLLVHGAEDTIIPAQDSERAASTLRGLGIEAGLHILPGIGHGIPPEGVALAQDFLAGLFSPDGAETRDV